MADKNKQKDIKHLTLESKRKKSEKISFAYNFSTYLSFIKKYKFIAIFVTLTVLIVEAINIGERYLLKTVIDKATDFSSGLIQYQAFISLGITIAIIFALMVLIKSIGKWSNIHFINRLEAKAIQDLKRKYFNHILNLSHNFHTSHKTGSLIARLTRGGRAMEKMSDIFIFQFFPLTFQFIVAAISIVFLDIPSAIALVCIIAVFLGYSLFNQQIQQNANLKANEAEDIEKGHISDFFTNVDSIRYFGKASKIQERFEKISDNTRRFAMKHWDYFRWLDSIQAIILGIGTFLMVYLPISSFLAGKTTVGTVVFVYTVYFGLMGALFSFVYGLRDFYRVMADFEDLFQYGKIENEIKDKTNAKECSIKEGTVEFKNLNFSYGKRKIFSNLNLKINKNEKVALVGHSGSGKTTLVKLLFRFYDLDSGKVLLDNQDITDLKQESLREELSIVPQEGILFNDTIYNNIAFSNSKAGREEVLEAIKFSQLDDFISKLPNKESTIVGERGVKLSGGEKQRVSIARAILADKKILVLDEATSSLDSKTEYQIQRDLQRLMKSRTTIIIAHRLSTVMSSDKIVVMDKGKIVQIGKHNDLIKKPGMYKELWNLQKGGYLAE